MAYIYGDIMKIDTTGASEATAKQDKLTIKGVEASKKLAEHDLARMEKYKSMITKVGKAKKIDPAVIAAIISRESRAGALLKNGWEPVGNGFGLMQVDKRHHTPVGAWDSEQHVTQATEILISFIKEMKAKFPMWSQEQCFKGGISAYNAGVSTVRSYETIDARTTGQDYSNDVVARAKWFKSKGY
ncbi:lysozyme g-like [Onychostoma macrolepis]|uniref:lysozyme g-like n=1 Tax=Onychostoma macrolepis TaxID=369639 RepID=UPI00272DB516|nr:lysozyme g-like [Onychostoma macrolepis]XP_058653309.1 lysozyme g-like [Onychostoma macrolepis]